MSFPGSSVSKQSAYYVGDPGSVLGSGRSSGEGNGNPLQNSCLENSMDRGTWKYSSWGLKESDMTERLTHTWAYYPFILSFILTRIYYAKVRTIVVWGSKE